MATPEEQLRLGHLAASQREASAAVPAPSAQPRPESHTEAMATAHEGRPTVAEQQKRKVYP
jgi:hypothetical protein